jgi:hypothetical protein
MIALKDICTDKNGNIVPCDSPEAAYSIARKDAEVPVEVLDKLKTKSAEPKPPPKK